MTTKEGIANTRASCAKQRAENLAVLGSKTVIELCVGPSLYDLQAAYNAHGIVVVGNDIDPSYNKYGAWNWIIGDALTINLRNFDTAVFAPPLSKGFSGKREDSLMIDEVQPSYRDFLKRPGYMPRLIVLVLPGRSLSTKEDRMQLHRLKNHLIRGYHIDMVELKDERNRVTKYVDLYLRKRL